MSHKSYVQTGNATTITGTKTPDDIDNETHKSGVEHTPVETSSGPTSSAEMKKIASPVRAEVLLAAVKFAEAALQADLEYAVVGGVSALIFGSTRETSGLDILYVPNPDGPLVDDDPSIFGCRTPNDKNAIMFIDQAQQLGIPLNLINLRHNMYGFPDLHDPILPDSCASDDNDAEPTWDYYSIHFQDRDKPVNVRVLLPRLLLQQRLLKFPTREGESDPDERKKKDVADIATYLKALFGSNDQSFKSEEVDELIDNAREVMRFAEKHGICEGLDVARWRWIMIPLVEGDWREKEIS